MTFQLPLVELFEQCEELIRRKTVATSVPGRVDRRVFVDHVWFALARCTQPPLSSTFLDLHRLFALELSRFRCGSMPQATKGSAAQDEVEVIFGLRFSNENWNLISHTLPQHARTVSGIAREHRIPDFACRPPLAANQANQWPQAVYHPLTEPRGNRPSAFIAIC
jgi:hypothetical protein